MTVRAWTDDELYAALYQIAPDSPRYKVLQTEAMYRQLLSSRKAAEAAELAAQATASYARYTLWVLVATALTAAATWIALFRS